MFWSSAWTSSVSFSHLMSLTFTWHIPPSPSFPSLTCTSFVTFSSFFLNLHLSFFLITSPRTWVGRHQHPLIQNWLDVHTQSTQLSYLRFLQSPRLVYLYATLSRTTRLPTLLHPLTASSDVTYTLLWHIYHRIHNTAAQWGYELLCSIFDMLPFPHLLFSPSSFRCSSSPSEHGFPLCLNCSTKKS